MLLRDPDSATAPVVGLAERYEPGRVEEHTHRRAQLMFALEGALTILTSAGMWVLPPHRALLIPGRVAHSHLIRKPVELRTLYIDETTGWVEVRRDPAVLQMSPLLRELVLAALDAPWNYEAESTHGRLARVLCERLAQVRHEPVHVPQPREPRMQKLAAIYDANPAERRPLPELAKEVGASTRTLERMFRAEMGQSVGAWVQQRRLIAALELLADGMSVGDAAFNVGFENPSSFIALFKRQFGTTPGQYFPA
jgi:AraC-like DNA-binding protein